MHAILAWEKNNKGCFMVKFAPAKTDTDGRYCPLKE
jgi:hypothetical protein